MALPAAAAAERANLEFVAVGWPADAALPPGIARGPAVAAVPNNLARAALALPLALSRAHLDLFHAPAYTAPLLGSTPMVLTIHDVSYARRPEFYAYRSGRVRQWFYRRSAWRAAHIITDSEFSKREIVAAYGIPDSRITVVPLGVGPEFTRGSARSFAERPSIVRPYLLHVGDLHPRRNIEMAARAIVEVNRRRGPAAGPGVQLVCAGADSGSASVVKAVFAAAGQTDALRLTGPVSEADLLELYRGAAAFIYPSLYEGFGLPVLEAMACGTPVVALRAGSVPEVVGNAGILVDEGDERGLAEAVWRLLDQPERAAALGDRGAARAAAFNWSSTARATLAVYLACLRSSTAGT